MFARLWRQSQRQGYAIKTTEAPHYRRFVIQHEKHNGVRIGDRLKSRHAPPGINDGKGVMFVSHVGKIHPSGFLPMLCGRFPATNVVHAYQNSPVFRGLRDSHRAARAPTQAPRLLHNTSVADGARPCE